MENKNIIIIGAVGILVILAAAWFIFDPFGSESQNAVESQTSVQQQQTSPPVTEPPKEETKVDTSKKEKKQVKQNGEDKVYIVKEGDTLQKIAMDYYGETKYWFKIFGANEPNIDWYDNIRPGQELIIPEIN